MKILTSEFIGSAVSPGQYPVDGLPELALVGRSNVGKSSLINTIAGRRNLARISSNPGKTQTLNFYRLNDRFYLVDLPGYGFARVSGSLKAKWRGMIEGYLEKRAYLAGVVQLVDARHQPTEDDLLMFEWLKHYGKASAVVITKSDKISRGSWEGQRKLVESRMGADGIPVIPFSAQTGVGREQLLAVIGRIVGAPKSLAP
jgi:GTP-binding protein